MEVALLGSRELQISRASESQESRVKSQESREKVIAYEIMRSANVAARLLRVDLIEHGLNDGALVVLRRLANEDCRTVPISVGGVSAVDGLGFELLVGKKTHCVGHFAVKDPPERMPVAIVTARAIVSK